MNDKKVTEIRPFQGIRYNGNVTGLISQPYDVLDQSDKDSLLATNPDNIVSVDLPHMPPKELGTDAEYQASADKLNSMLASGKMQRESAPALYAYSQSYEWAGVQYTRRALICGVRATEMREGVWPHELTFAGPKADRLRLTEISKVQLSSIFGFFDDSDGASEALWSAVGDSEAVCEGELGPVREKLWAVTDVDAIEKISAALADKPIFIADGHHRYTTALNYRNALRDAGKIDENHPANFVLFTLVAMDDPGLLVLPTHRMVSGVTDGYDAEKLVAEASCFEWTKIDISDQLLDDPDSVLAPYGQGAMAVLDRDLSRAYVGKLTDLEAMRKAAPDRSDLWRSLDVSILHKLLLDTIVSPHAGGGEMHPNYTAKGREVAESLKSGACDIAFILQGTPLSAVKDIALDCDVMPHKSTYFYPKLASGMVLKPVE